jgi:hypothetical protein
MGLALLLYALPFHFSLPPLSFGISFTTSFVTRFLVIIVNILLYLLTRQSGGRARVVIGHD